MAISPVPRSPAPAKPARTKRPARSKPKAPPGPGRQAPAGKSKRPRPNGLDRSAPKAKPKRAPTRPAARAPARPAKQDNFRDLGDPAARKKDRGDVTSTRQPGQVIKNGISPRDVEQGAIGDCYFCAGLSSVAQAQPGWLRDNITDNGDGTYGVKLYDGRGKPHTVTVDDELYRKKAGSDPRYAKGTDRSELWPALYEKAYAKFRGDYETIGDGGQARRAMQTITGKPSDRMHNQSLSVDGLWNRVNDALDHNRPIATDTYGSEKKYVKSGLVDGHAYSVLGTEKDGEDRYVVLRNPWGSTEYQNQGYGTDVDFDKDGKMDGDDGVFRMKIQDFHRLFEHTDVNDVPKKPGMMSRLFGGLFG